MTTLDSLPLVQALMAMVDAGTDFPHYLAGAPRDEVGRFAVWYPDTGIQSAVHRNLVNDGPDELRFQVTSVGVGPEQAMWVADRVSSLLLAGTPTVAGRRVWRTVEESSQPVRRDDDTTGLWFCTSQYLTRSDA